MKIWTAIIIFNLFFSVNTWGQDYLIKGNIIEYQSLFPMEYTAIGFDTSNCCVADENGNFEFKISKLKLEDTLKISFLSYYDIFVINLPGNEPIIDLGKIPMFEYFVGHDMSTFYCQFWNFRCKRNEKKHWKAENDRISNYFDKMDGIISYYTYIFRKETFKIENHIIDLSNPYEN